MPASINPSRRQKAQDPEEAEVVIVPDNIVLITSQDRLISQSHHQKAQDRLISRSHLQKVQDRSISQTHHQKAQDRLINQSHHQKVQDRLQAKSAKVLDHLDLIIHAPLMSQSLRQKVQGQATAEVARVLASAAHTTTIIRPEHHQNMINLIWILM